MTDREANGERVDDDSASVTGSWRVTRGLLSAAGLLVFVAALFVVVVPESQRLVPVEAATRLLGSDYVVVAAVGLVAVGLSAFIAAARHVRGVVEANPPVVERVQSATYPGAAFDRPSGSRVDRWARESAETDRRERLTETAVRATMRANGCSRDVAERRVESGEWTDDPLAADYLSDTRHAAGGAGETRRRGDRPGNAARQTADAVARLGDDRNAGGREGER